MAARRELFSERGTRENKVSDDVESQLIEHGNDELAEELLRSIEMLKSNSQGLRNGVVEDNSLLTEMDTQFGVSTSGLQTTIGRVREIGSTVKWKVVFYMVAVIFVLFVILYYTVLAKH